jgi:lysozyme family protein
MKAPSLESCAPEYRRLFRELALRPQWRNELDRQANRIAARRARYEDVALKLPNGVPWFGIALLHAMEADLSFETHLHNGDSLRARTVHEPRGLPKGGNPPFTWEASAIDALRYDGWHKHTDWSLPGLLYMMEAYNGWGTREHGVATPYLWSGSQHYTAGKYISDHVWSATAVSEQLGAAVILHELCSRGVAVFRAELTTSEATA